MNSNNIITDIANKIVYGKTINLRDVDILDAKFILSLRLNNEKSCFISATSTDLDAQLNYINNYKSKKNEWYFIIESKQNEPLGTVRIYDIRKDSFCWGSWIVKHGAPPQTAVESAILIYEFAFYSLGFLKSHFDVRKANTSVISFHEGCGAHIVSEDEINYYFNFSKEDYEKIRAKYKRFLP